MDPARQSSAHTPEEFGPYEVYERLGMGGMASVHRAKKRGPVGFERTVALKRMLSHLTEDRNFVDSFVREAKVASMLVHHNIAQTYDFGRINGVFYIAMELVGGFDLRKLLRHAHKTNEPIPLPVVLSILCELCEALDYAHSFIDENGSFLNIVHRDISPSNMIISPMGHVKVIDFGIAKANSRQLHTDTGSVKGKLGYMAPEVALGMQVAAVSDVFSAGVVAWEMVTALPLFSARTDFETMRKLREEPVTPPSRHNSTCPALLDQVILAALSREPDQRLTSARAFRTVLDQIAAQQGIQVSARAVVEWMRDFGPASEMVRLSTASTPGGGAGPPPSTLALGGISSRQLPLPAGPETQVTSPSRPNRIPGSARPSSALRRSDEDIALATEIWGEDATAAPEEPGEDFSMAIGPGPSGYVESLPGTPIGAQIPSLASSQRVHVIAPSQAGFPMTGPGAAVAPAPTSRTKTPLFILAGLAIVAGVLGGVLYAKKSFTATASNAVVHFAVEPAGSTVEVAGKDLGTTADTELAPGVYSIVVRHDGYKPWSTSITLRDGDNQTINVALTSEPVAIAAPQQPPVQVGSGSAAVVVANDPPDGDDGGDKKPGIDKKGATHSHHHTTQAVLPDKDPEPAKVEPTKVEPTKVEPTKVEPTKVEPTKVEPTKVEPTKVEPPVDIKPKTTPVVGPSAVTKLAGEVPQLHGRSGDSSDILAKMCIDESGRVSSVTIKKSPAEIAGDLQRALMTWKYKPYVNKDSKVTPVCFPLSIRVILKQ